MTSRHRVDGTFCCECDFCAVSPCAPRPFDTIGFTGYHHYLVYCTAHEGAAEQAAKAWLMEHPSSTVEVESDMSADHFARRLADRTHQAQLRDMPLDTILAFLRERGWVVGESWVWRGVDALAEDDAPLPFEVGRE